ncbi:MAG: hypothetical protein ABL999_05540 [Pyrinomonadaceae bacterium]
MNRILFVLATFLLTSTIHAQPGAQIDLVQFERRAVMSKELGATHVVVTEGLPLATWEADPSDPYPAWFMHHISMLKVFPPKDVQPYVNAEYAAKVSLILEKRCEILRKLGLKAIWNANEPGVMPEAFFTAYPELRGPRIDQPNRSTKAHFAPSSDDPETLRIYRESIQLLLKRCPDVELFNWVTTDAGSGFDYAPGLYPGPNGNTKYKNRPMEDRVSGFMINIQKAAKEAGRDIAIHLRPIEPRQWMVPTFSPEVLRAIVRLLPRGLAVQGLEGPDGRAFAGAGTGGGGTFSPVVGMVVPSFSQRTSDVQPRVVVSLGDAASTDFNYRLLKATRNLPQKTLSERIAALRTFAVTEVGEEQADNLIEVWSSLNAVEQNLNSLNFGAMLRFGHILNRWVTRPMVPFPDRLTADEKKDYRRFLFQAKGEEQAENLADIQGMRMYEGWGARLLFQRNLELTMPQMRNAQTRIEKIRDSAKTDDSRKYWDLTAKRLQAATLLLQSADNMIAYQAQLDRVKSLDIAPEANPVLGVQSGWDRADLMETARREIDTMIALKRLLDSTKDPILDLAPTADEESIMRLGPNVSAQIKHKIDTMNAHWLDYDRLFTKPNP